VDILYNKASDTGSQVKSAIEVIPGIIRIKSGFLTETN
jgi:hypothetical protein